MRKLGNFLWNIFGGIIFSVLWYLIGIVFCVTLIGIPIGKQFIKAAKLWLSPFGRTVYSEFNDYPVANTVWCVFFGIFAAIISYALGAVFCVTVIGIPFGIQWFKIGKFVLFPFGAMIE